MQWHRKPFGSGKRAVDTKCVPYASHFKDKGGCISFIVKERRWFSLGFPAPVIHLVQDIWGGSHSSKQAAQNGMRNILESVFLFERSTKKTNNFDSFVVWQKTNA